MTNPGAQSAPGQFGAGQQIKAGQRSIFKPRIVFEETKPVKAAFSFIAASLGESSKGAMRRPIEGGGAGGGAKGTNSKFSNSHPSVPSDADDDEDADEDDDEDADEDDEEPPCT